MQTFQENQCGALGFSFDINDINEIRSLMEIEFSRFKGDLEYRLTSALYEENHVVSTALMNELENSPAPQSGESFFEDTPPEDLGEYSDDIQRMIEDSTRF